MLGVNLIAKLRNFKYPSLLPILLFSIYSTFLAWKMYDFPKGLQSVKIFDTDGIFTQTQIQTFVDGAILFPTNHLGFPNGFSQWSSPQFSPIDGLIIWILANLFDISNYGLISVIGIYIILCNAISYFYLAKIYNLNKLTQYFFGFLAASSPYVLNSVMHPHVMKIITIPFFLILLKIFDSGQYLKLKEKILEFLL